MTVAAYDGVPNLCGAIPDSGGCIQPTVCDQGAAGKLCGVVGDGCGGLLDCGGCQPGYSCGGAGTPSVCGASADSGVCDREVCNPSRGLYCGDVGDGCGGTLHCGNCPLGQLCGARGPGVCGAPCPLCSMIPTCSEASVTTISGTVFTGALNQPDPIYNAQGFHSEYPATLPRPSTSPSIRRSKRTRILTAGASCSAISTLPMRGRTV